MTAAPKQVSIPFTEDQVRSLNEYQASGIFHEFTCICGNNKNLIATAQGLKCPDNCGYIQDWAWAWMADGSWRGALRK